VFAQERQEAFGLFAGAGTVGVSQDQDAHHWLTSPARSASKGGK
jgi:hypothetical protein